DTRWSSRLCRRGGKSRPSSVRRTGEASCGRSARIPCWGMPSSPGRGSPKPRGVSRGLVSHSQSFRSLTRAAIRHNSTTRYAMKRAEVEALRKFRPGERPIFFCVSGADDLQPDAQGTISECSRLRAHPRGFAYVGIPVRQLVEASGIDATYVYFGNLVYGSGK